MRIPRKLPFWDRVKTLLRAQKITQKELAALVNLNYSTLKFWLCYGYYPDVETACDIAHILGVPVEHLINPPVQRKRIYHKPRIQKDQVPENSFH